MTNLTISNYLNNNNNFFVKTKKIKNKTYFKVCFYNGLDDNPANLLETAGNKAEAIMASAIKYLTTEVYYINRRGGTGCNEETLWLEKAKFIRDIKRINNSTNWKGMIKYLSKVIIDPVYEF